jgi:hypothetical protein
MIATGLLKCNAISAFDFRCDAGPADRPFAELHESHSLSYVRKGSFGYRLRGRMFELVAGSVLIGRPGDEYVCTHEHHACGDECLSFHLAPALVEMIANSYGTTLRVYDPRIDAWQIQWTDPVTQSYLNMTGRREDNDIVQLGTSADGDTIRWSFRDIAPDSFRWLGEVSADKGKTWRTVVEFWARRI